MADLSDMNFIKIAGKLREVGSGNGLSMEGLVA